VYTLMVLDTLPVALSNCWEVELEHRFGELSGESRERRRPCKACEFPT
jgi:hypothetical protein